MKKIILCLLLVLSYCLFSQENTNFKTFKLNNGLTVVLDKDPSQKSVFGVVGVNAGSNDEKLDATGVAHYLEHMLFKGTTELGTSDWASEKKHYYKIIELYDELEKATSKEQEIEIYKKINSESQEQSKYVIPNEFSKLIQQMGGVGLNATTSLDRTNYFNEFPTHQLEKWLDLYSHRFINPVFRLFQTELETVYEEKNRSVDNPMNGFFTAVNKSMFEGHPYSRPIIGKTAHLKKPSMSKMIAFYEKWYVPSNMILILSGNFDMSIAEKLVKDKFGRLKKGSQEINNYKPKKLTDFKGKKKIKLKLTPYMVSSKVFNGPDDIYSDEAIALQVVQELLSNRGSTGILDALGLDGKVMFAGANFAGMKHGSKFTIQYAPVFDSNQRRQTSFKSAESLINNRMKVLYSGEFSLKLLEQVKSSLLQEFDLSLESSHSRAFGILDCFVNGKSPLSFFDFAKRVRAITKNDIKNVVKKYFNDNYLLIYSTKGEAKKEKLEKPQIDPIKPIEHEPSVYANFFEGIKTPDFVKDYVSFSKDMKRGLLKDKVNFYYVPNKRNKLFSLTLDFHAGTFDYPKLQYAVGLMNNSGISSVFTTPELKKEFGKIGVKYGFRVSDNSTYVNLSGNEDSLSEACVLLSKLMVMPKIKDESLNRILGNIYYSRTREKKIAKSQFDALQDYLKYGAKSPYIDRLSFNDIKNLRPTEMIAEFNKAIKHEVDVHYYGAKPINDVANTLINNLAFVSNRIPADKPMSIERVKYKANNVYVVNNNNVTQSQVFIYVPSNTVPLRRRAVVEAFNSYFGGGFNGVVLKEIREFRSYAYTAGANFNLPFLPNESGALYGVLGTQVDKTNDAIKLFVDLLNNMPVYESRMKSINDYLYNSSAMDRPKDRYLSRTILKWEEQGYKSDPRVLNVASYKVLKMRDVVNFYQKYIKGKPYQIGIVGPLKKMDKKLLRSLGNLKVISSSKLFSIK